MGTDIHMRTFVADGDGWKLAKWQQPSYAARHIQIMKEQGREKEIDKYWTDQPKTEGFAYTERNYNVFAILADVRNGRGFAGVVTGDGFEPIAEPRGLPEDMGFIGREDEEYGGNWYGDHSFSWLTLQEILDVDWDGKTTIERGVVGVEAYVAWKKSGNKSPDSYCGEVGGGNVRVIIEQEMIEALERHGQGWSFAGAPSINPETGKASDGMVYFTGVQWTCTYREAVGEDFMAWVEEARRLADKAKLGYDQVRFVFGFDS